MPKKRIPVDDPLPQAGQSADKLADDLLWDKYLFHALVATVCLLLIIWEWYFWLMKVRPHPVFISLFCGAIALVAVWRGLRALPQVRQYRVGSKGEKVVGQMLEGLRRDGYEVFHDIPGGDFNLDHVVVGPAGVFVIETKTIRKGKRAIVLYRGDEVLVDGFKPDRDPVRQVKALRDWLWKRLEEDLGERYPIRGVLFYPGWWIDGSSSGKDVWVLEPKALAAFLRQEGEKLPEREVRLIAGRLRDYSKRRK